MSTFWKQLYLGPSKIQTLIDRLDALGKTTTESEDEEYIARGFASKPICQPQHHSGWKYGQARIQEIKDEDTRARAKAKARKIGFG